jgi:hypothetical protein
MLMAVKLVNEGAIDRSRARWASTQSDDSAQGATSNVVSPWTTSSAPSHCRPVTWKMQGTSVESHPKLIP